MKNTTLAELYSIYLNHPIISKDTREITESCIYFSLKGDIFDGNKFAEQAIKNGAAYVVIDNEDYHKGVNYLLVEDCLKSLQDLAKYHRKNLTIPIIGISGSNGKTTTKELIATALSKKFKTLFTEGNYNNHIGVPLTILRIHKEHEIAIIEMGANHQKEIEFLCSIAQPTCGMLTNIGKAHLEGFGGELGVEKGKTELFKFLEATNGITFINADDEKIVKNKPSTKTISYGIVNRADCSGRILETHPQLIGEWSFNERIGKINSSLYGEYNFYNILAACCIATYFEVEANDISSAINNYHSEMNRSELKIIGSNSIYFDAYNANPTSMELAIENFEKVKAKKKIAIIGDMFEIGDTASKEHNSIIEQVKTKTNFDLTIFVGENFFELNNEEKDTYFFKNTLKAKEWFDLRNIEDATILLKGSRGMKLEQIISQI